MRNKNVLNINRYEESKVIQEMKLYYPGIKLNDVMKKLVELWIRDKE